MAKRSTAMLLNTRREPDHIAALRKQRPEICRISPFDLPFHLVGR